MNPSDRPNRLLEESSPYLRQHAYNPVNWFPWGKEALDLARRENRPILLSIGYSACHWCHVMERESFEDEAIAGIMNDHFVNIKVDREERPDLDDIYMTAVQAISGSGGWPMTVFLTPDLLPFFGGTYFPPEDRHGRPGFARVLETVARHFADNPKAVEEGAEKVMQVLREGERFSAAGEGDWQQAIEAAVEQLAAAYDDVNGGFGEEPKFPNSMALGLLLRHHRRGGEEAELGMVMHTLRKMALGGIYDQLGGGFHRYSVDARWLVPHFEKMLYDNALLATTYLEAYQYAGDTLFKRVVVETINYVLREMTGANGGFYATQDADSEGEEGLFFVWRPEEVTGVLGEEAGAWFNQYYGVSLAGNFEGSNILHVQHEVEAVAGGLGIGTDSLRQVLEDGKRQLLAFRQRRITPHCDEKVIVAWNGMMISSMARAGQALAEDDFISGAKKAAQFILQELVVDGNLMHLFKDGRARFSAYQDDYGALVTALLDLYEITQSPSWLEAARRFSNQMIDLFWDDDEGGFFFAGGDSDDLILRTKNPLDGATPSGNSLAAGALLRLACIDDDAAMRQRVERIFARFHGMIQRAPTSCCMLLSALDYYLDSPFEIALIGNETQRRQLLTFAARNFLPNKVIVGADPSDDTANLSPLLHGKVDPHLDLPRGYVCRNSVCAEPVTDPEALAHLLS